MVSVSVLRRANKKSIVKLIRENPSISRKELTKRLNVSRNTVSLAVEELILEGIVEEKKIQLGEKGIGRPTVALDICADSLLVGSINVSPFEVKVNIYNYRLNIIKAYQFSFDNSVTALKEIIHEIAKECPSLIGITIIIPGIVMSSEGKVIYSEKLNWRKIDLLNKLSSEIDVPLYLQNNVKCIGIYQSWRLKSDEAIYYLKIDKSVGSAIIVNRDIWSGFNHIAGEISHIKLSDGRTLEESINISLYDEAHEDDKLSLVQNAAKEVAQIIKNVIVLINPNRIIIESKYCQETYFQTSIYEILNQQLLDDLIGALPIDFYTDISDSLIGGAINTIYEYEKIESIS